MIVYHGTTLEIRHPDITHSKAHLDFGSGFYTTSFREQAERWASRKGMRLSMPAIVNVYEIGDLSAFRLKQFDDTDLEWLRFVVDCRNGLTDYKSFDAVIGSVANDDVFKCVSMFMDGIWDEDRTLNEIRFFKKNDQIAFLTQTIIDDAVVFKDSYEVKE
jgi:hypothetical protein